MPPQPQRQNEDPQDPLACLVAQALRGLKFGSVEVVVHDGRVVQLERRERQRFERPLDTLNRGS